METKTVSWLLACLTVTALVAAAGLAVHYRGRALDLQEQWETAQSERQSLQARIRSASAEASRTDSGTTETPQLPAGMFEVTADRDPTQLQARVRQLETVVAARDSLIQSLQLAVTNRSAETDRPWGDRQQNWLENLKTEDPHRYGEIMKQREESRQRVRDSFAQKAAHLMSRDTSGMAEEEQEQYNQMLQLLNETWGLADQLKSDLPQDQRREISRTLRENMRTLTPLMESERNKEFYELGLDLGYNTNDAVEFVNYLTNVIDITSMRSVFQNMGPSPGSSRWNDRSPPARP